MKKPVDKPTLSFGSLKLYGKGKIGNVLVQRLSTKMKQMNTQLRDKSGLWIFTLPRGSAKRGDLINIF